MSIFDLPYIVDMMYDFADNHLFRLLGFSLIFGFGLAFLVCVISYVIFKFYSYLSAIH